MLNYEKSPTFHFKVLLVAFFSPQAMLQQRTIFMQISVLNNLMLSHLVSLYHLFINNMILLYSKEDYI